MTRLKVFSFTKADWQEESVEVNSIPCMYGISTYICLIFMVNLGKYTINGCYGNGNSPKLRCPTGHNGPVSLVLMLGRTSFG